MTQTTEPPSPPSPHAPGASGRTTPASAAHTACGDEAMLCEGCGQAEMYRMHAVWRCPDCGFKTDCCGW